MRLGGKEYSTIRVEIIEANALMNYGHHYSRLIERARKRVLCGGYFEKHHVVPRCIGGDNSSENIVRLTAEEHLIAHLLLVRIHPLSENLIYAANLMSVSGVHQKRLNNKSYGWVRKRLAIAVGNRHRGKTISEEHRNQLCRPMLPETKAKISSFHLGKKKSLEHRKHIADAKRGVPRSVETKAKLSAALKGRTREPFSDVTKARMSVALRGRVLSPESRAKISAGNRAYQLAKRAAQSGVSI